MKKNKLKIQFFFASLILICNSLLYTQKIFENYLFDLLNPDYDKKNIKVISQKSKAPHLFLTYLWDDSHKLSYLMKRRMNDNPQNYVYMVVEVLCTKIAEIANISTDRAEVIPPDQSFPKKLDNELVTLHTLAPGQSVGSCHYLKNCCIFQHSRNTSFIPTIRAMAKYQDLPKIAALDAFIANNDRHNENMFYDKKTKRFTGIDFGNSFRHNLCNHLIKLIDPLLDDNTLTFNQQVLEAVIDYKNTLKTLIDLFPPEIIYQIFEACISDSKIFEFFPDCSQQYMDKINNYKENISANVTEAKNLVDVLEKFICKYGPLYTVATFA